jgi:hypothetical protein
MMMKTEKEEEDTEVVEAAVVVVVAEVDAVATTKIENMEIDKTTETERDHNIERSKNLKVMMMMKKNKNMLLLRRRVLLRDLRAILKLMKATSQLFD